MSYFSEAPKRSEEYSFEEYLIERELLNKEKLGDDLEAYIQGLLEIHYEAYLEELHKRTTDIIGDKTKCLDVSEINDSISKTVLYLLAPAFDYFKDSDKFIKCINTVMGENISEWNKITRIVEGKLSLLRYIICLKDKGKNYWIKDCFGLYNPGIALVKFRDMDEEIQLIATKSEKADREDNLLLLIGIEETITFWNYGLVSVLWENYGYKYSSKRGMAVLNNGYLQEVLRMFKCKYSIYLESFWDDLSDVNKTDFMDMYYLFSKHEIDLKCNSIRMQYAELAYMYSPFVEESRKKDIEELFNILWKITQDGEIARVYIEENEYKVKKSIEEIGKNDRTTRIHIIFSLENTDIYSLRIDMPHKGVNYAHLNLQEIENGYVVDSAMPILDVKIMNEIKALLGEDVNKYFYESGEDLWWFRVGFLKRIEEIEENENLCRLKEIFDLQKHFELKILNDGYELFNEFKYYLKMFLSKFVQINRPFEIEEEIIKYRCILWCREMLENVFLGIDEEELVNAQIVMYVKKIKEELIKVMQEFSVEELNELAWRDTLELLVQEFWNMD